MLVAGVGMFMTVATLVVSFFPSSSLSARANVAYEVTLALSFIVSIAAPFIIYHFQYRWHTPSGMELHHESSGVYTCIPEAPVHTSESHVRVSQSPVHTSGLHTSIHADSSAPASESVSSPTAVQAKHRVKNNVSNASKKARTRSTRSHEAWSGDSYK